MADTNNVKQKKPGMGKRMSGFFKETKAELKKVSWPTKEQLMHNTGVILVFIIVATIILSLLDVGFGKLFEVLTQLF